MSQKNKQVEGIDQVELALSMVVNLNKIQKAQGKSSDMYKKQHAAIVRNVLDLNRQFGKGFTSISDLRSVIQNASRIIT